MIEDIFLDLASSCYRLNGSLAKNVEVTTPQTSSSAGDKILMTKKSWRAALKTPIVPFYQKASVSTCTVTRLKLFSSDQEEDTFAISLGSNPKLHHILWEQISMASLHKCRTVSDDLSLFKLPNEVCVLLFLPSVS